MHRKLLTLLICLLGTSVMGQLTNNGATIVIESGATLYVEGNVENLAGGIITNNGVLEVQGNLTNTSSTLTNAAGSKFIFSGTGNSTLTSTSGLSFQTIEMNKTAADVILASDVTVNTNINFLATDNFVNLGTNNFTIGTSATITGAASDRFFLTPGIGKLQKESLSTTAAFSFPVGFGESEYNPISIKSNSGTPTVGVTMFANVHETGNSSASTQITSDDVINATWIVDGGTDLDVTANWDSGDQPAGFVASKSGLSQWDNTEMKWDLTLEDGLGVGATSASRAGVSPGAFAVGSKAVMDWAYVTPQLVLSGPYNGNTTGALMNANLTGILPGGEPYAAMGNFTHSGVGGGETATNFRGIVDWVFVEVRRASDNTHVLGSFAALLNSNGDIVATDQSSLKLHGLVSGASSPGYNLAIRHRNHLGVMTSSAVGAGTLNRSTPEMVNFKGGSAFGSNAMKDNGNTVFSLWAGDIDGMNQVSYDGGVNPGRTDLFNLIKGHPGNIFSSTTYTFNEYSTYDIDLDGQVSYDGGVNPGRTNLFNLVKGHPGNIFSSTTFTFSSNIPN